METRDILSSILDTEEEARRLCRQVEEMRSGLEARITAEKKHLRTQYDEDANAKIRDFAAAEAARTDTLLAKLEAETDERIAGLEKRFHEARDAYCDRLFSEVIGADDGE